MYTHYHPQMRQATEQEFLNITDDLRTLYQLLGGAWPALCGKVSVTPVNMEKVEHGAGPVVASDHILFNGAGGDDFSHEDFHLPFEHEPAGPWENTRRYPYGYNFTKTARAPYDIWVCAALIISHSRAPGWLSIASDGRASDTYPNDWMPALAKLNDCLCAGTGVEYALPPKVALPRTQQPV